MGYTPRRLTLRLRLQCLGIAVGVSSACLACWLYLLNLQADARLAADATHRARAAQLSRSASLQASAVLEGIDASLRYLRGVYLQTPQGFAAAADGIVKAYPQGMVERVVVTDATGQVVSGDRPLAEALTVADRDYFRVLARAGTDQPFLGPVVDGRSARRPLVHLARPVRLGTAFAGVIVVGLRPEFLSGNLVALRPEAGDLVGLLRRDGGYIALSDAGAGDLARRLEPDLLGSAAAPGPQPGGELAMAPGPDRTPARLLQWMPVGSWPLLAMAAVDTAAANASMHRAQALERDWALATLLPVALCSLAIAWLWGRSGRQRDALEQLTELQRQQLADTRVAAATFESQIALMVTDATKRILKVNQAFTAITGYTLADVAGRNPSLLSSGRHDRAFYRAMNEALTRHGHWSGELWNRRKNGEVYPEKLVITAVRGADGDVTHYVGSFTDQTAQKQHEDEIRRIAYYDPLTELPNRRLMIDRLDQCVLQCASSNRRVALMYIDIDDFKMINDTQGHPVGDLLLKKVAGRLRHRLRPSDLAARFGGDEFVVLLDGLSSSESEAASQARAVAHELLASLGRPYQLDDREHWASFSLGIALMAGRDANASLTLQQADMALYKAKGAGRNQVRLFNPAMQSEVDARATLEQGLRCAIDESQLELHYQPQVLARGGVSGVEALVRWRHPQRGLVPPDQFIPLAEETGLIHAIGHWVLDTACRQLVAWSQQPDLRHLSIAVNVSAKQLLKEDFVAAVFDILDVTGAPAQRLKLEITESVLLGDLALTVQRMNALRARGICFSLDDFGTGFSSLYYLKRLPIDTIKLDKTFVQGVHLEVNDARITEAVLRLAGSLELAVIAEGVETEAQHAFLQALGCDAYQGYLFARPQPAAQAEASIAALQASQPAALALAG